MVATAEKPRYRPHGDGTFSLVGGPAPVVDVSQLNPAAYAGQQSFAHNQFSIWDGAKFAGGMGAVQLQRLDYWALRRRSVQLFRENLYARGLIRRFITNEINTGISPESTPDEEIIGVPEDSLADWTELVENRFHIYGKSPRHCDFLQKSTFAAIQRAARMEALISGDVLVVMRYNRRGLPPSVQLVSGAAVQNPLGGQADLPEGHTIDHGVERDANRRVVAHWIRNEDGESRRLPAYSARTGRRVSWLVYGTEKLLDDVRGEPLLSIVLQSLKEIDRYRDSAQRKAVINSILAMYIKKGEDKMGSLPTTGGAVRKDSFTVSDSGGDGPRNYDLAGQIPGLVMEELQQGEEPVGFGNDGTDINFPIFEEAMVQAIAWANEVPPEILRLAFSNNYSASQAAINEFKIYLNKFWVSWGEEFCTPIYNEWLINEVLTGKIQAPGFLDAWRNPLMYDVFGAWVLTEWYGTIKPSTDMQKQARGAQMLVENGWSTNAREARNATGTKWSKNIARLARENERKAEAMRPLLEMRNMFAGQGSSAGQEIADSITEAMAQILEA